MVDHVPLPSPRVQPGPVGPVPEVSPHDPQALRRAEIMTSDKAHSVKFCFTKNNLKITANTPDVGEARENIAINYSGDDITVSFNPLYMMDPLKVLDDDEVFLEMSEELSPGVIKVQTPFVYVIMPMRTNTPS